MEIFICIVNMSISASILAAAVIIFRLLFRKAPKWLNVCLWGLVALRLICPVSFESEMSLVPNNEVIPTEILSIEPNRGIESTTFEVISNPRYSDIINSEVQVTSIDSFQMDTVYLTLGWLSGIGIMLLYAVISYLRIYFKTRQSIRFRENIFICDLIDTPFIFGVVRPRIYLPSSMNSEDTEYVVAHEKAHLRRKDYLWKPLGFLLLTVYWFNPVMWLSYILLCRDIELACDEKVIREMGAENKKNYSTALINCSVPGKMITACPVAFGEIGVKKRIKAVLNYKKPAFWIIATALVGSIILGVCFMTDPISQEEGEYEWYFNPTYSAVGYGILTFQLDSDYEITDVKCDKGSINIYDRFYNRLEEEKTGKNVGWSPDYLNDAPDEAEIKITAEKNGVKAEYNIRVEKSENQNTEDRIGMYYTIIPLDCSIKEEGWAVYSIKNEGLSVADSALDKAVSEAILSVNSEGKWLGECPAEGHIIFGKRQKGDITEVYLLENFSSFGFENGWFIERSGHSIPCTMRFENTEDGYKFLDVEYARDGSEHIKSIKEMFPAIYVRRATSTTKKDREKIWKQTVSYAEAYLKKIGREAKIGTYGDIEHILLTDVGISVDVSNKLSGLKVAFDTGEIGFYEVLEDGVRYVYRTSYAQEQKRIIYTKEKYGTGEIVEKIEIDSLTGNIVEVFNTPEYMSFFDAEVIDIKKNGSYALVKPHENSDERALSDKFHVSLEADNVPELYEGLHIRIFYNGEREMEEDGTYTIDTTSAIYLYADMNYIGEEAPTASSKQPTTRGYVIEGTTVPSVKSEKLCYSYASEKIHGASLILSPEDRRFTFSLSVLSSYLPMGTYEETDELIILKTDDGKNEYVFIKKNANLLFSAEKSSPVPEYKYETKGKAVPCIPDKAVFEIQK